ncbi:Ig-like domain-containing protein, partial [bacterium]|nr:Ig-like domain-containing protein [bacterium]
MKLTSLFWVAFVLLLAACGNPFGSQGQQGSVLDPGHHPGAQLPDGADASQSTISVSGTYTADGADVATVTITLKDLYAIPVAGQTPTFSATDTAGGNSYGPCSASDANGVSTCFFASTKAESKSFEMLTPVSVTGGTALFVHGPLAYIEFTQEPGGGVAGAAWAQQPKLGYFDAYGNPVVNGAEAAASATAVLSSGTGVLSGSATVVASGGEASFSGLSVDLAGSGKQLTATVVNAAAQSLTATSAAFAITAAAPDTALSGLSASPTSLFADGQSETTLTVSLVDAFGNPAPGQSVSVSSSRGATDTILPSSQNTGASGEAVFTATSNTAGSAVFTASGVTQTASVTFVSFVASAAQSSVTVLPTSVAANATSYATITATARNAAGDALPGKTLGFASSRGATDTLSLASAATGSDGKASITVKSSTAGDAVITVTSPDDSVTLAPTPTVLFLGADPSADWQPRFATGSAPGSNASQTTIEDLQARGSNYGTLNGFAYNPATSGWATAPYRLLLDGVSSYIGFGLGLNTSANFSLEAWVRPEAVASRGVVIASNGDTARSGITLRQTWDALGRVSIHLGARSYAEEVLADNPAAYWRLGDATATAVDSSGGGGSGSYQGGYTLQQTHAWGDADKAVALNGSSGYVQTPYVQNAVTAYSVEAWIKTTDAGAKKVIFHNRGNSGTTGKSLTLGIGTTGGGHG